MWLSPFVQRVSGWTDLSPESIECLLPSADPMALSALDHNKISAAIFRLEVIANVENKAFVRILI